MAKHFVFGEFRLEPANHLLLRSGTTVPLVPKAFDTLVYLVENHQRLVTREELMQAVWPDSFVEGANLTVYISLLRKALGEPPFIETVPRKGYRFTVEVQVVEGDVPPEPVPQVDLPRRRTPHRIAIWAAPLGVILGLAALWVILANIRHTTKFRQVRLTSFGPELAVSAAAISPDGKLAAYANAAGIFIQPVETGEAHPLAAPQASFTALSISWFPDGSKLLVSGFGAKEDSPAVWLIQAIGEGAPVKVGEGLNAAVSPDGRLIAMSGPVIPGSPERSRVAGREIRLMRSDREDSRTVATAAPGETLGPVSWTGDGRLIWVRYRWDSQLRKNSGSIESYDTGTRQTSVVLKGSNFTGDAAGLARGQIVYAQLLGANPSSKYGAKLFAVDSASRASLISESSEPIAGLSASATASRLLIRNSVVEHSVVVAGLRAGEPEMDGTRHLTHGLGREDFARAWTADSRAVVFDSNRNGTWELFKQGLDSATDDILVHSSNDAFSPRLSPDGTSFLYMERPQGWNEPTPVSILRMPAAGGPAELVLKAPGISEWGLRFECAEVPGRPCVLAQHEGGQIVFRRFDAVRGLGQDGGEVARIDFDPMHPIAWSLAPDGGRLAWTRLETAQAVVHVLALEPNERAPDVTVRDTSHVHSLHWSADGKGWFLTSEWPVSWAISYAGMDGHVRVLSQGSGMYAPDVYPSPDSRRLAYSEQVTESNLWLLEGF